MEPCDTCKNPVERLSEDNLELKWSDQGDSYIVFYCDKCNKELKERKKHGTRQRNN